MIEKFKNYLIESQQEFRRVNWPTRQETIHLTLIVIGVSIGLALFLGAWDMSFSYLLDKFLISKI